MVKRQSNIELLRIIIMLMIISGHIIQATDYELFSMDYYVLNFIESLFGSQVNVFILISGYFGIKLKFYKLSQMDLRVVLYTYVLFAVAVLLGIHSISFRRDILLIFPVLTKQYWFITDYFVLCLLSPFLNWFLSRQSKRNLQILLIVGFLLFYVIATGAFLVNADQIVNDAGRGIINFVFLYILGYYLRNCFNDTIASSIRYFLLYIITVLLNYFSQLGMTRVLGFYFNSLMSNNTIFVLLGAVFLFLTFKNLDFGYFPFINSVASKTLAVYIIHTFPFFPSYVYLTVIQVQNYNGPLLYAICLFAPIIIYAVCFIIDLLLDYLLKPVDGLLKRLLINKEIKLDE